MTFAIVNPELLLIRLAIVGIVFAMFKWNEVGDIVMNTLQILFDGAKIGLNTILWITNGITSAFFAAVTGALKLAAAISLNKEAKKGLEDLAAGAWKLAQRYNELSSNALKNAAEAGKNVFNVLTTGQSDFSRGFDDMKIQAQSWIDLFKNLGSQEIGVNNWQEASKTFAQGWRDAMDKTIADLRNWGSMAEGIVQSMSSNMQSIFSSFFQNFLKGEIESAKDLFVEFGNFVLKIISDVIAQFITAKIITGMGSLFSAPTASASTSTNISTWSAPTPNLTTHAEGIEDVPYTGDYKLHEGERVIPKYDATKGSGVIELTLHNNITPEAIAAAMSGREGAGVIVNTIDINALRNGSSRRTIRRK
jgi:hypothetical protein